MKPDQIPSTGILALYWLLRYCKVKRIHLVGFDGFAKSRSKAHHYWNERSFRRPSEHDGDAELRLLHHWSAAGRVAFLT